MEGEIGENPELMDTFRFNPVNEYEIFPQANLW